MATIIRGKNRGKDAVIRQWCNDWFNVDVEGKPFIVSPLSIKLNPKEIIDVANHDDNGIMFRLFTLTDEGTFKRNRGKK